MKFKDIKIGQRYFVDFKDSEDNSFTGYGVVVSKNPPSYPKNCIEMKLEGYDEDDLNSEGYFGAEDIKYCAPNLLAKTKFYLVGGIEFEKDFGASWRDEIKEKLKSVNICWFDPLHKIFVKDVDESGAAQVNFRDLRSKGKFDELATQMKEIRSYDLSMVDRADAIIFYYDVNTPTTGSWEELFHGNSLKRPIFFICKQGVKNVPLWLFGTIPHKYFYNSIDEVVETIKSIDNGSKVLDNSRWRLLHKNYR